LGGYLWFPATAAIWPQPPARELNGHDFSFGGFRGRNNLLFMKQRGRRSTASLSVVTPLGSHLRRMEPPEGLDPIDSALFRKIVASCSVDHFSQADAPLLSAYCQAVRISRRAFEASLTDASHIVAWEKSTRTLALLATRLRLSPHSRAGPKAIGRHAAQSTLSYYDLDQEDEGPSQPN
jgi:phage terminase small subunit